jgi:hypothetical protein
MPCGKSAALCVQCNKVVLKSLRDNALNLRDNALNLKDNALSLTRGQDTGTLGVHPRAARLKHDAASDIAQPLDACFFVVSCGWRKGLCSMHELGHSCAVHIWHST